MTLYQLLIQATVHKDTSAAWEIVQRFDPLLNRYAFDPLERAVDEDLKSDMQIVLYTRILHRFKMESS